MVSTCDVINYLPKVVKDLNNLEYRNKVMYGAFLSAIALYFSVEKPEPKKLTIIDIIFIWFYIVNGFTITAFSLSSLITEKIHYYTSGTLKFLIPLSLVSIAVYLSKRVKNNRKDIILDRDL